MAEIYEAIEDDVLPKLRKATITLRVYEPKKTEEDIVSLSIADPSQLDIKEMLFAASLIEENSIKKTIYNTVSKSFPYDYRAYNNLAGIYIKRKEYKQSN